MSIAVVNLGLKSLRCMVFDERGRKLAHAARSVHSFLRANEVEQDAGEWIHALHDVIRSVVGQVPATSLRTMTITTSASCLVPVDAQGEPTHRVLMVSDSRCGEEAAELTRRVRSRGGAWGDATITTDLVPPKILWLRRHRPRSFEQTRYFFTPADFLIHYITGQAVTDPHNASKYLAVEAPSGSHRYPEWIGEELGVGPDRLPGIERPGARIGKVRRELAAECGLSPDVEVYLATYDAICAVLGSGVAAPGRAAVVSGTVTSVRALTVAEQLASGPGVYAGSWIEPDEHCLVGGSNNLGGGLVEWHKQAFYRGGTEDPYELMNTESEEVPPGAEGLLFLPYLLGERAPIWDPDVRGIFFGLDRRHTRSHFTRSVFESVAFSARHILEHVVAAGCTVDEIRFSGGLARLPAVPRILAHVLQRPVLIPEDFETTSAGAFIICARALGWFASLQEACDAVVRVKAAAEPDPGLADFYASYFELYKRLYEDTRDLQRVRRELIGGFPALLDAATTTRENL